MPSWDIWGRCWATRASLICKGAGHVAIRTCGFYRRIGAALIRKHTGIDQVFTPEGYRYFADYLLERMTNPFLVDTIERVTRDTERKLGWSDRLTGTMRVALKEGITPCRYALGALPPCWFGLSLPS